MEVPADDDVCLSPETLKILNEFIQEKIERERKEQEQILGKAEVDVEFAEDWQLSQFWYNQKTKDTIKNVLGKLVADIGQNCNIALLSCPSVYKSIKEIHDKVKLFEFDERFAAYGKDFIHYDFNEGLREDYLEIMENTFDVLVVDPPFLSEECITKMAKIVKRIAKTNGKIIFCSGEVVEPWITVELDLKKCRFRPEHERNLGNEFVSYANFDLDDIITHR